MKAAALGVLDVRVKSLAFLFAVLAATSAEAQVTRDAIETLEQQLLDARPTAMPQAVRETDGSFRTVALEVLLPDSRSIPVLVQLPPQFEPAKRWPLLLAMHGGPMPNARSALQGASRMLRVWDGPAASAGVIVVSPAMTHVVARAPRPEQTLPYEILRPEQMEALLHDVAALYPVDPNRIVSTGISLGSNFPIAFAASRPDRFAAIVPVSTEGESREHLLRNLMHVPTFVLEGKLDRNIRSIQGPRAMERILESFEYDIVYREMSDRSHEGFAEHYPEVLRWLAERPRNPYPKEVVRVPHDGIMALARRVHWIESDTRRGIVRARVTSRKRIDIDARWVRSLRVFLTDHLVDLDAPIEIHINGERVYRGAADRSLELAAEDVRERAIPDASTRRRCASACRRPSRVSKKRAPFPGHSSRATRKAYFPSGKCTPSALSKIAWRRSASRATSCKETSEASSPRFASMPSKTGACSAKWDSKKATCSWKSTASPSSTTAPFPSFALGSSASSTRVLESSLCAFFDGAPSSRSM